MRSPWTTPLHIRGSGQQVGHLNGSLVRKFLISSARIIGRKYGRLENENPINELRSNSYLRHVRADDNGLWPAGCTAAKYTGTSTRRPTPGWRWRTRWPRPTRNGSISTDAPAA